MISAKLTERPHIFSLQNICQNHFQKIEKCEKVHCGKIKILKNKAGMLENICHLLDVLLP